MDKQYTAAVLLATLLSGCQSPPKPVSVREIEQPYQQPSRIQYLSHGLSERAEVVRHSAERTESGLLRVRTAFRNHEGRDIVVEIKLTFTDDQGFEKESTNWEPVILGRYDITTYSRASLGSQVADYRLAIRDPKEFKTD